MNLQFHNSILWNLPIFIYLFFFCFSCPPAYSVLSDKKKRSLYDLVGHETYLQTETSFDPEDKPQNSFHFSFSDFFDGHLFVDESPSHWSFIRVEEDARYKRYSFQEPNINFYFEDIFENEEDYYY